jgi:hypothetical protein
MLKRLLLLCGLSAAILRAQNPPPIHSWSEAESLESDLDSHPDDVNSRLQLLRYYAGQGSDSAERVKPLRRKQIIWFIEHEPHSLYRIKISGRRYLRAPCRKAAIGPGLNILDLDAIRYNHPLMTIRGMPIAFLILGCCAASAQTASQTKSPADEGTQSVVIRAVIGVDGIPFRPVVVKGIDAEKDRASLDAFRQWRFRPGMKNGKPVPIVAKVQINFGPRGDSATPQVSQAPGLHLQTAEEDHALLEYYVSRADGGDTDAQVEASLRLSNKSSPDEDVVRARAWAIIAAKGGSKEAAKLRVKVEKRMTASQIDAADRAAEEWRPGSPLNVQ